MSSLLAAIRPAAIALNVLVLVVGGFYAAQGHLLAATGGLLGAFNLLTLTRLGEQGPTRFVALVPAVLAVMGGSLGLGIVVADLTANARPDRALSIGLPAACYFLAGTLTTFWILLVSLGHVANLADRA